MCLLRGCPGSVEAHRVGGLTGGVHPGFRQLPTGSPTPEPVVPVLQGRDVPGLTPLARNDITGAPWRGEASLVSHPCPPRRTGGEVKNHQFQPCPPLEWMSTPEKYPGTTPKTPSVQGVRPQVVGETQVGEGGALKTVKDQGVFPLGWSVKKGVGWFGRLRSKAGRFSFCYFY